MATEAPASAKPLHVLAVHENADFLAVMQPLLADAPVGQCFLHPCSSYAQAGDELQRLPRVDDTGRRALAVLGAAAPERKGGRPDYDHHAAARKFLLRLQAERPDVLVLVLSSEEDDHGLIEQLRGIANARLAIVSPVHEWERMLTEAATEAAATTADAAARQRTRTVIHIDVFDTSHGAWTMERRGQVYAKFGGPLTTDPEEMHYLCKDADRVETRSGESDWGDLVSRIGRRLSKQIFDRNPELQREFEDATREDQKRPQLRLVFSLEPSLHKLPMEALKRAAAAPPQAPGRPVSVPAIGGPSGEAEWHALNSPMLRHYPAPDGTPPLFFDARSRQQPVNVLLIAADPRPGVVSDADGAGDIEFNRLERIEAEVAAIRRALAQADAGRVGEIKVLKLARRADPKKALFQALRPTAHQAPWHIVHFAGHTVLLGARRDRPCLVLSPEPDQVCSLVELARVLDGVRLLFLSSCQSANADCLSLALQEHIPAILGYRWPVDDGHAADMAATFYGALFSGQETSRSMGRALLFARKSMFKAYPGAATWASPLLLTKGQVGAAPRESIEIRSGLS